MKVDSPKRKGNGAARPIKTERDYKGAASVVKKIAGEPNRESAAEKRLQSLIKEMEKFDDPEDDSGTEDAEDGYGGPRRRWSDDESPDAD